MRRRKAAKTIFVLAPNNEEDVKVDINESLEALLEYLKCLAADSPITVLASFGESRDSGSSIIGTAIYSNLKAKLIVYEEFSLKHDGKNYPAAFCRVRQNLYFDDKKEILVVIVYEKFFIHLTSFYATAVLDYPATTYIQDPMSLWIVNNLNKKFPSVTHMPAKDYKKFVIENNLLPENT